MAGGCICFYLKLKEVILLMVEEKDNIQKNSEDTLSLLSSNPLGINKIRDVLVTWLSLPLWSYVLFVSYFGPPEAFVFRSIFLTFVMVICFLTRPLKKEIKNFFNIYNLIDLFLILLTVFVEIYVLWDFKAFQGRMGIPTPIDKIIGVLFILLVLEVARRAIGWTIVTLSVIFIITISYANLLPGIFRAPAVNFNWVIATLFMGYDGIYGLPIGVIASIVALFILFGSFLQVTKAANVFIDLSMALAGKYTGGPAKVAVVASALTGTISGSSVANVVTTGSFTIPLMKKIGYSSTFAGAVEAVASTGGMLMPPVMGAAAFIIAEFLGVPYLEVMKAALIPALLYYFACFLAVHQQAKKRGLKGLSSKDIPKVANVLKSGGHLLIPLLVIIIGLIQGFSPARACLLGLISLLFLSSIKKTTRLSPISIIEAFDQASRNLIIPAIACACAGIIVGSVFVAGLGIKFVTVFLTLSHGILWLLLIFTMFASLILGMGLPATAVYITVFIITVPSLTHIGVLPMAAHLFAYIFGIISGITPPVAITAFAAAGISGAAASKTGWAAFLIGAPIYIIPFMMVYYPSLLMIGSPFSIIYSILICLLAISCTSSAIAGFFIYFNLKLYERLALFFAGIMFFFHVWYLVLIGLLIFAFIVLKQIKNKKTIREELT